MATSEPSPTAERSLFTALIDDAAVFPPGNAPLDRAAVEHRALMGRPDADLVGPLLVPAAAVTDLVGLTVAGPRRPAPLPVAVIGRPGTEAAALSAAVQAADGSGVLVTGLEIGADADWRSLTGHGLPLAVEVPRGAAMTPAIADIAAVASDTVPVQAKFRTGPTPTWPWPDEVELAGFIRASIDHDLGFKLTGGLHHAVRGSYAVAGGSAEEQHGLLNVLSAVRWALNGEEVDALVDLLAERDPAVLVAMVTRMSVADAAITRAFFTAYGCCGVTDPIGELRALHLIEEPAA